VINDRNDSGNGTGDADSRTRVQFWFRAPKIWEDFLEKKAAKEYCSKSDLLRHAFRLVYGKELEEFRINPGPRNMSDGDCPLPNSKNLTETVLTSTPILYDFQADPWVESMAAFVANKSSTQTQRVYRLVLKQFFTFITKHPSGVKQSDIIRYRHYLEHLDRAPSTIRQHLATISGYYSFCITRDLTLHNPVKGVNRPLVGAYNNATWLSKMRARILLTQPDRNTVKGKRDYAILVTLLLTGLRRSELTNIKRGDIQIRGERIYLTYTSKGGMKLVRDIPKRCWDVIEEYLNASGREVTEDSPLFTPTTNAGERLRHYYGKNGRNGQTSLTSEAIRQMVSCYSRRAFGEKFKVTPHTLRHTAGTLLRKSGRSIEDVQSFLKHRRIDTTRRYLHVVEADDSEFGECIARMLDL